MNIFIISRMLLSYLSTWPTEKARDCKSFIPSLNMCVKFLNAWTFFEIMNFFKFLKTERAKGVSGRREEQAVGGRSKRALLGLTQPHDLGENRSTPRSSKANARWKFEGLSVGAIPFPSGLKPRQCYVSLSISIINAIAQSIPEWAGPLSAPSWFAGKSHF